MTILNTVFMGTPDFALPALEALAVHPLINLKMAITMPARKSGRGQKQQDPPVAQFCKAHKIECFQTENINKEDQLLEQLESDNIDLIIVLAFAQFLGKRVLDIPSIGPFNIHTSLLPKYRGAAPIQYALLSGDKRTGVSIQKMIKKMDAGNIVFESEVEISPKETGGQLYTRLKFQAALSLSDFIWALDRQEIVEREQDETAVSLAPVIKKEDGHLSPSTQTALEIDRKIRALSPWPGTYVFYQKKRLKIIDAKVIESSKKTPGHVSHNGHQIFLHCEESSLEINRLQLEGKKVQNVQDFLNGLQGKFEGEVE